MKTSLLILQQSQAEELEQFILDSLFGMPMRSTFERLLKQSSYDSGGKDILALPDFELDRISRLYEKPTILSLLEGRVGNLTSVSPILKFTNWL
jgi:hypothetical protein